jgi:NTE family protein
MFELLNASYDATLDRLVELTLELRRPDVLIEIPRDVCRIFDFHRAAEVFAAGKAAYRAAQWPSSPLVRPAPVALTT